MNCVRTALAGSERDGDQRFRKRENMSSLEKQIQLCQARMRGPQTHGTRRASCAVSSSCALGPRADKGREVNRFVCGWKFPSGSEGKTEGKITYLGCTQGFSRHDRLWILR